MLNLFFMFFKCSIANSILFTVLLTILAVRICLEWTFKKHEILALILFFLLINLHHQQDNCIQVNVTFGISTMIPSDADTIYPFNFLKIQSIYCIYYPIKSSFISMNACGSINILCFPIAWLEIVLKSFFIIIVKKSNCLNINLYSFFE